MTASRRSKTQKGRKSGRSGASALADFQTMARADTRMVALEKRADRTDGAQVVGDKEKGLLLYQEFQGLQWRWLARGKFDEALERSVAQRKISALAAAGIFSRVKADLDCRSRENSSGGTDTWALLKSIGLIGDARAIASIPLEEIVRRTQNLMQQAGLPSSATLVFFPRPIHPAALAMGGLGQKYAMTNALLGWENQDVITKILEQSQAAEDRRTPAEGEVVISWRIWPFVIRMDTPTSPAENDPACDLDRFLEENMSEIAKGDGWQHSYEDGPGVSILPPEDFSFAVGDTAIAFISLQASILARTHGLKPDAKVSLAFAQGGNPNYLKFPFVSGGESIGSAQVDQYGMLLADDQWFDRLVDLFDSDLDEEEQQALQAIARKALVH